jgi:hypothetical protein
VTKITIDLTGARQTTWLQAASRFLVRGITTALVGIIGKKFGPGIGGLFLAFPAIFPASATLIEKRELEKKRRAGMNGEKRSRDVAAVDAAGAAMGSTGLDGFALFIYKSLVTNPSSEVLSGAVLIWMVISVLVWRIAKSI